MGKISVRHYLNKRLKPSDINGTGSLSYPVYMLITYKRKQFQLKSREIGNLYSEEEFRQINIENTALALSAQLEANRIEALIKRVESDKGYKFEPRYLFEQYDRLLTAVYEAVYQLYDIMMSLDLSSKRDQIELNLLSEGVFLFREFDRKKEIDIYAWEFSDIRHKFSAFLLNKGIDPRKSQTYRVNNNKLSRHLTFD